MIGTQRRPSEHHGMQYMDWCPSIQILKPHPLSEKIYGSEEGAELLVSIEKNGVLEPIIVRGGTNQILSGNRRWLASKMLMDRNHPDSPEGKFGHIPAVVFDGSDAEAELILIESNRQRIKTDLQIQNEVRELTRIESELAKQRQLAQLNQGTISPVRVNSPERGTAASKIAAITGESESKTKERIAINEAAANGDTAPMEALEIGGSVHAAAEVIGKRRTCKHCGDKFASQAQRKKHERNHPESVQAKVVQQVEQPAQQENGDSTPTPSLQHSAETVSETFYIQRDSETGEFFEDVSEVCDAARFSESEVIDERLLVSGYEWVKVTAVYTLEPTAPSPTPMPSPENIAPTPQAPQLNDLHTCDDDRITYRDCARGHFETAQNDYWQALALWKTARAIEEASQPRPPVPSDDAPPELTDHNKPPTLYDPNFLTKDEADALFEFCRQQGSERPKNERNSTLLRRLRMPCWSATPAFRASRNEKTNPWMRRFEDAPALLKTLAEKLTALAGKPINYLSLVGYASEKDHIGWHQHREDDCRDARVFIVSLGETRTFGVREVCPEGRLCAKCNDAACNGGVNTCKSCKAARKHRKTCPKCKDRKNWTLFQPIHGSLITLPHEYNKTHEHAILDDREPKGLRISINTKHLTPEDIDYFCKLEAEAQPEAQPEAVRVYSIKRPHPADAIYVGCAGSWPGCECHREDIRSGSMFGNSYEPRVFGGHKRSPIAKTAEEYREKLDRKWRSTEPNDVQWRERAIKELRGKSLLCWCLQPKDCHARVLFEYVNDPPHPNPRKPATSFGRRRSPQPRGQPREKEPSHDARRFRPRAPSGTEND